MDTFPENLCETGRARIVSGDERQVMGSSGDRVVGVVETMK